MRHDRALVGLLVAWLAFTLFGVWLGVVVFGGFFGVALVYVVTYQSVNLVLWLCRWPRRYFDRTL